MFYFLKNKHDSDMYDIATKKSDGEWQVWGQVHVDFFLDSNVGVFFNELPDKIRMRQDDALRFITEIAK